MTGSAPKPPRWTARVATAVVLLALVFVPAPLLPPTGLVATVQSAAGIDLAAAYLVATIALHGLFYGVLGAVAALAVGPGCTRRQRWQRFVLVPVVLVGVVVLLRSLKLGHVPMLANAIVPMAACALGAGLGIARRQHGARATLLAASGLAILLAALHWPGAFAGEDRAVTAVLQRLVAAGPTLPAGDERFVRLVQLAFATDPAAAGTPSVVEHNWAAILALGIVLGHEQLARFAGIDGDSPPVRAAVQLRRGTTVRGREDWVRHFCTSASLAVVQSAFVSDLGGLLKEELDALTAGTGFSFGDLAADRAGVRFAEAATASPASGLALSARLQAGFAVADVFPPVADLAENLTVEQFRRDYGGVGAPRYRAVLADIEDRLDRCPALRRP